MYVPKAGLFIPSIFPNKNKELDSKAAVFPALIIASASLYASLLPFIFQSKDKDKVLPFFN